MEQTNIFKSLSFSSELIEAALIRAMLGFQVPLVAVRRLGGNGPSAISQCNKTKAMRRRSPEHQSYLPHHLLNRIIDSAKSLEISEVGIG